MNVIKFYNTAGQHLFTLDVPRAKVNAFTWDSSGHRLALALDSHIFFAEVLPDYTWTFFENTLVYAYRTSNHETRVMFWNTITSETHVNIVNGLISITSCRDICVMATHGRDPGRFDLTFCDRTGHASFKRQVEVTSAMLFFRSNLYFFVFIAD